MARGAQSFTRLGGTTPPTSHARPEPKASLPPRGGPGVWSAGLRWPGPLQVSCLHLGVRSPCLGRLRTKRRCTWTFPGALCVFKASGGVGVRKPRSLLKIEVTSTFLPWKTCYLPFCVSYRRHLWWLFKLQKIAQACVTSALSSVHDAGP